jgi:hypothetical protein
MKDHSWICRSCLHGALLFLLLLPSFGSCNENQAALERAMKWGNYEKVEEVLGRGDKSLDLDQALIQALYDKQYDIAKLLVLKGADANGGKRAGTPVYLAAKVNNRSLLEFLVSNGASLDAAPLDSKVTVDTPLLSAIYYGEIDAVRLLLESGAQVNHVNRYGNTPLDQAIKYTAGDGQEIVRLLLKYGADPDMEDQYGLSARLKAERSGNKQIIDMISQAKPAEPMPARSAPVYTYTLKNLEAEKVAALLGGTEGSTGKYEADYEPSNRRASGDTSDKSGCERVVSFKPVISRNESSLQVATCGRGIYDANNLHTSIRIAEAERLRLLAQNEANSKDESRRAAFEAMQERERKISDTETVYAFMNIAIGHGVFFIPTGVVVDSGTNTSFVVHVIDPAKKFLDTGNVEDLVLRLYLMAKN